MAPIVVELNPSEESPLFVVLTVIGSMAAVGSIVLTAFMCGCGGKKKEVEAPVTEEPPAPELPQMPEETPLPPPPEPVEQSTKTAVDPKSQAAMSTTAIVRNAQTLQLMSEVGDVNLIPAKKADPMAMPSFVLMESKVGQTGTQTGQTQMGLKSAVSGGRSTTAVVGGKTTTTPSVGTFRSTVTGASGRSAKHVTTTTVSGGTTKAPGTTTKTEVTRSTKPGTTTKTEATESTTQVTTTRTTLASAIGKSKSKVSVVGGKSLTALSTTDTTHTAPTSQIVGKERNKRRSLKAQAI